MPAWIRSQSWTPLLPGRQGWAEVSGLSPEEEPALLLVLARDRWEVAASGPSLLLQELFSDFIAGWSSLRGCDYCIVPVVCGLRLVTRAGLFHREALSYQVFFLLRYLRASGWWELLELLERVSWEMTPEAAWHNWSFCCPTGSKESKGQKATQGQMSAAKAEQVVVTHPLGL